MLGELAGSVISEVSKHMNEVKEMIKPTKENFRNIKPKEGMTVKKAENFWKDELSKKSESKVEGAQGFKESSQSEIGKELTPKQQEELIDKGMSPGRIKDCRFDDGLYRLKTINEDLAGKKHPDTGVEYEKKVVDLKGSKIEGVFPKFDFAYETILPEKMLKASDSVQFRYCNEQLKKAINEDPSLKDKFNSTQLDQISKGLNPRGWTWHHNEDTGKMELVKTDTHARTPHVGGKAIWGGGR